MKTTVCLLVVILAGLAASRASAGTDSLGSAKAPLLLADAISVAANTNTAFTGNGGTTMGWIGVGVGALSMAVGLTTDDAEWLAASGGIAAGMGLCSILLSGHREQEETATRQLKLVPGLSRIDGALEPRLTLKLNF
jgi:hypothetical protein